MRTLLLIITFGLQVSLLSAQNTLTVNITNLNNNEGVVMIKLSDSNEKIIKGLQAEIVDNKCTVEIKDLANGSYALSYFHDENSNGELDTNFIGMPKEGFGFSNNAKGSMGPPKFKDQIFEINSDLTIDLKTEKL